MGGPRIVVGRAIWTIVAAAALVLFAVGFPARLAQLSSIVASFSPVQLAVLPNLGIEPDTYPFVAIGIDVVVTGAFLAVSALICWRSDDRVAVGISVVLLGLAIWISPTVDALLAPDSIWRTPSNAAQALGWGATMGVLYIFPDGRFVPRWARPMVLVLALVVGAWILIPTSPFNLAERFRLPPSSYALLMAIVVAGVAAQVYRFLVVAGPVQRQQTKWVLFGIALQVLGFGLFGLERLVLLSQPDTGTVIAALDLIGAPVALLFAVFILLGYFFSILRYRLWDIDFLINHALVYSALTAILSGLYIASIGFSQRLFVAVTGNRSEAAVVISTLVVAAAFTPARNRLQAIADRYFRESADPMKRIKAFRDDVHSLVELVDVELITRRALEEAGDAFGATAGSMHLWRTGKLDLVHQYGDGPGDSRMSVRLLSHGDEIGLMALGPRRDGRAYTERDRAILEDLADQVAAAIALLGASRYGRMPAARSNRL